MPIDIDSLADMVHRAGDPQWSDDDYESEYASQMWDMQKRLESEARIWVNRIRWIVMDAGIEPSMFFREHGDAILDVIEEAFNEYE